MARLNEVTTPMESIDILKRRFIRQNREIARVNSMQSLRIRGLESEVSHLLAENVSLREQVITLSQELERFEVARSLHEGVHDIKSRLDDKLSELNNLVIELGALPRRFAKPCEERSDAANERPPRFSAPESTSKETHSGNKSVPEEQGRLPAIQEDKCYPRKTLELQEIQSLVDCELETYTFQEPGEAQSVSKAIDDSKISPEHSPRKSEISETASTDREFDEAALPPTLETRKRKKLNPAIATDSCLSNPTFFSEQDTAHSDSRTGTKRKFSTDCVGEYEQILTDDDDFEFSRPGRLRPGENGPSASTRERGSSVRQEAQLKLTAKCHNVPRRRVLKPKDANLSNTFLKKVHPADIKDCDHEGLSERKDEDEDLNSVRVKQRKNIQDSNGLDQKFEVAPDEGDPRNAVEFVDPEAEKSSLSSPGVSSHQHENEDISGMSSFPSRPSRRQRSVVSYAEPNLRDKMRRPTNEFAPAVAREHLKRPPSTDATQDSTIGEGLQDTVTLVTQVEKPCDPSETLSTVQRQSTAGSTKSSVNTVPRRKRKTIPSKNAQSLRDVDTDQDVTDRLVGAAQFDGVLQSNRLEHEFPNGNMTSAVSAENTDIHDPQVPVEIHLRSTSDRVRQPRRHSSQPKTSMDDAGRNSKVASVAAARTLSSSSIDSNASLATSPTRDVKTNCTGMDGEANCDLQATGARQFRRGQRATARRKTMMI